MSDDDVTTTYYDNREYRDGTAKVDVGMAVSTGPPCMTPSVCNSYYIATIVLGVLLGVAIIACVVVGLAACNKLGPSRS